MQYGLIGERLGHSFSKIVHGYLAEYEYELCELPREDVDAFLCKREFCAINVTIPYKETVIPYLSYIDPHAEEIGAVNTIVNRDGRLYGYNTDFYGMKSLIERMELDFCGKKVAILGTGGTSRTAMAVAKALGAAEYFRVSRTAKGGAIDYESLYRDHADTDFIINTTPAGMYPNIDDAPIDLEKFSAISGVIDAIYNPLRPKLLTKAREMGIPAEGGLYMLVAQAVRAAEIFLDRSYPTDTCEVIYRRILRQKENIVLIGMPGCGKSTVGKLLAEKLSREIYDMDTCIVQTAGKEITDIFSAVGESGFRDLETRVLKEQLARMGGIVLATGGGAILRDENVAALRQNGRLYFLDRPLCDLLPTADRPTASSTEAIRRRYEERYFRYCSVADVRIPVDASPEEIAEKIRKDFLA